MIGFHIYLIGLAYFLIIGLFNLNPKSALRVGYMVAAGLFWPFWVTMSMLQLPTAFAKTVNGGKEL